MKVVILCGGKGSRLKEETEFRPKPLVMIGGKPILWHIMKTYAHYGHTEFILCLGYKGHMIKEYFLNYEAMNNDCTVRLGKKHSVQFHTDHEENEWTVTLVDTGDEAQTGARIKRIEKYITDDVFMATYGDGVADINIANLVSLYKKCGKKGVITGVHPASRFGELVLENGVTVKQFSEKPQVKEGLINGGYFVFNKNVFNYLKDEEECCLETGLLERLSSEGQLDAYVHDGFWQCVDTYRELTLLNTLWASPQPAWKVWK